MNDDDKKNQPREVFGPEPVRAPEDRPLTIKQKKFVRELLKPGVKQVDALYNAGYEPGSRTNAHLMANTLKKKPNVKKAIDDLFAEYYPDADENVFALLKKQIRIASESEYLDPHVLAIIKYYMQLKGLEAPKKIESKNLNAKISWPGKKPTHE